MPCVAISSMAGLAAPRLLHRQLGSCSSAGRSPLAAAPREAPLVAAPMRRRVSVAPAAAAGSGTVQVIVQGRHMTVTAPIKEYAEQKVAKATHAFESAIKEVDVKLSVQGKHGGRSTDAHHQRDQIVEVTVYTKRHGVVRVEDTESDLYAAIDLVTDKLRRKLTKVKERAIQNNTWPGRGGTKGGESLDAVLDEEAPEPLDFDREVPPPAEVIREKLLILSRTQTREEALEEIENVGHDFYIFLDAADSQLKVVYRRKNYGYGVIAPQLQLE